MKKISLLTLASFLFTTAACAQAPVFTTLSSAGSNIFAGVKLEKEGMEPETYLMQVTSEKMSSQKVQLPTELAHREVVGLFSTEDNKLLVMTQRTVEQGDKPLLHTFDPVKKEWKKIAEADCPSFAKIKVEPSALTFKCSETNEKGVEVISDKKVSLSGVKLKASGELTLPFQKVDQNQLKAELLGEAFEWKQLKVGFNKKEKVFTP